MGSKPSIPVVKLPRDTVVIVTGASSGKGVLPFFLTLLFILLSPVSKQPSSHFIQTRSDYFVGIEDIIMEICIHYTCNMYTFIE